MKWPLRFLQNIETFRSSQVDIAIGHTEEGERSEKEV